MFIQNFSLEAKYSKHIFYFFIFLIVLTIILRANHILLAQSFNWASRGGTWNFRDRQIFAVGAYGFNKAFCVYPTLNDFEFEVRLRKVSYNDGPIGLLLRYDELRDEGYMLLIWPHGDYQLSRLVSQTRHRIDSGSPQSLNRGNNWNTIKVIGRGAKLVLFINGYQELYINDNKYSSGKFGLVIHGDNAQKAEFTVLKLTP